IAEHYNIHVPFLLGGVAMLVAIAVLSTGHRLLGDAERASRRGAAEAPTRVPAQRDVVLAATTAPAGAPVVLAIDGGTAADAATATAIEVATRAEAPVHVLHVREIDVVADDVIDRESLAEARAIVDASVAELIDADVNAHGQVLETVADHAEIGRLIAGYARRVHARLVIVGAPTSGAFARLLDQASSHELMSGAPCDVLVVGGDREPERLTPVH
ncbi:MAG TPA: MFS transporter, partial [Micromonosporaceae bacterium]